MNFNWVSFLDRNNVEYAISGPNISAGNVGIACPFCQDDPSQHLVISTKGSGWFCWRNQQHRGKSPVRLVQALLHCSFEQAHHIVQGSSFLPDDFHAQVLSMLGANPAMFQSQDLIPLNLPQEFKPITRTKVLERIYINYLRNRDFTDQQIDKFTDRFDLRYCTTGAFSGRVIFPIRFEKRLVTWTGRTISKDTLPRYKTLSTTPEKAEKDGMPVALGPITNYLLWWDDLVRSRADTIVLCEGPFDALKVTTLGAQMGVVATCFFTQGPGPTQIDLLHELLPRFARRLLLLDQDAVASSIRVSTELLSLGVEQVALPYRINDPGAITTVKQLRGLLRYEKRS